MRIVDDHLLASTRPAAIVIDRNSLIARGGGALTLVGMLVAGVFWLGEMQGKIDALNPEAIGQAEAAALQSIREMVEGLNQPQSVHQAQAEALESILRAHQDASADLARTRADALEAIKSDREDATEAFEWLHATGVAAIREELQGSTAVQRLTRYLGRRWCDYTRGGNRRAGTWYVNHTDLPLDLAVQTQGYVLAFDQVRDPKSCSLIVRLIPRDVQAHVEHRVVHQQDLSNRATSVCSATVTVPARTAYSVDDASEADAPMMVVGWYELRAGC